MNPLIIILIIALCLSVPIFLDKPYRKLCIFFIHRKRQCLDNTAILHFYMDSGLSAIDILTLWYNIAEVLEIEPGYLRPSDSLNKIVALPFFSDDRIEEISDMAIKHNRRLAFSIDLQTIDTLDDYIRAFAAKE